MKPYIEAFIFDVDGVISSDTAEYHFLSWQQLAISGKGLVVSERPLFSGAPGAVDFGPLPAGN
jgi:beta-phosphoglucomutase-like phosphatase (HAD superfamily)